LNQSQKFIRNFSIIAHIDHGKSTLADRLLQRTGCVSEREMRDQVLDTMDLERERGITIKAQCARMPYRAKDGQDYFLNLIDTPGHVDFHHEVSRSLGASEGALLLVDASQGIEAQTLANFYKARERDVVVIPVINKIDLPRADIHNVALQMMELLDCDEDDILFASAKTGVGTEEILEAIVQRIPCPKGDFDAPMRALVVDSFFDQYRGVITLIRMVDGSVSTANDIRFISSGRIYEVDEVGVFTPKMTPVDRLVAGDVGYLIGGIKNVSEVDVGDTITTRRNPATEPLTPYQPAKPMVFCGLYPVDSVDYELLRDSLEKLHLNDASFYYEPESSEALGFGFRCGFSGLLHMDVIQERLEREYGLNLVATAPNVEYEVILTNGEKVMVDNPSSLPPRPNIEEIREPIVDATIITSQDTVGGIIRLAIDRRGTEKGSEYLEGGRVIMRYEFPLSEIVSDFFDRLKSVSSGYASFDYEFKGYRKSELTKLDILVNGDPVDSLSIILHRDKAYSRGRQLCEKLKEVVPRQQYAVAIQAAIGGKIIARETVPALRKNVTAKCYGGDITRKRKLLQRQKEGKKRMKQVGSVQIPQEAFMAILKVD
jgi:GTP-binding protein LepA